MSQNQLIQVWLFSERKMSRLAFPFWFPFNRPLTQIKLARWVGLVVFVVFLQASSMLSKVVVTSDQNTEFKTRALEWKAGMLNSSDQISILLPVVASGFVLQTPHLHQILESGSMLTVNTLSVKPSLSKRWGEWSLLVIFWVHIPCFMHFVFKTFYRFLSVCCLTTNWFLYYCEEQLRWHFLEALYFVFTELEPQNSWG